MRAAVRSQINLVMKKVETVKQMRNIRDTVYPIFWFQVRTLNIFHWTETDCETGKC